MRTIVSSVLPLALALITTTAADARPTPTTTKRASTTRRTAERRVPRASRTTPSRTHDTRAPARVKVRKTRRAVKADVRYRGAGRVVVSMEVGRRCSIDKVARVVAREIQSNSDAFWTDQNLTLSLPNLFGIGSRWGNDRRGRGDDDRGEGMDSDPMAGFEAAIADVLATGTHRGGSRGGGGETCFDGTNLDIGQLVQHNEADLSPAAGNKEISEQTDDGKYVVKTQHGDGMVTETLFDPNDNKLESTTTAPTSTGSMSVTTDHTTGTTEIIVESKGGSADTSIKIVIKGDGSSSVTHSATTGSGSSSVKVSSTDKWDDDGKHQGSDYEVEVDGKQTASGSTDPDPSKDATGEESGRRNDRRGEDLELEETEIGKVRLTPEGTVDVPPTCLPDAFMAALINWSRLQEAVTDPSPIANAEEAVTKSIDTGPCGQLEDEGFDPDPAYLKPDRTGWVTDPVPALRERSRRRP